jgi:hypothetical protein
MILQDGFVVQSLCLILILLDFMFNFIEPLEISGDYTMPIISKFSISAALVGAVALSVPPANAWGPWDRDRYYGPGYGYSPYDRRYYHRGWGDGWGDSYADIWDDMMGDMDMDFEVNFRTRGSGWGHGRGRGYGDYYGNYYDAYRRGYGYGPYYPAYYPPYAPVYPASSVGNEADEAVK